MHCCEFLKYAGFRIILYGFFAVLLTGFASCDRNMVFDQSVEIPATGWHKDSLAVFHLDLEDTSAFYNFYVTLRNNDEYPFRNFYFFLNTELPDGKVSRDTIELMLADVNGRWLGKGFGAVKSNQVLLRRSMRFPGNGTYIFMIEQAMRKTRLNGITDIGIRVEYADPPN